MPRSAASSIASEVGAPTPTRIGAPATAAFCDELEREPATHAEDLSGERQPPLPQRPADHLVHRVVAPDVLARGERLSRRVEEAGRMQAAGAQERGLAQTVGQGRRAANDRRPDRPAADGAMHRDLLQRALAADAARGGRIEAPRAGVAQQRALHLDHVRGEVVGQPDLARRRSRSSPRRAGSRARAPRRVPGVRIVTASGSPSTRISSGSSTATSSRSPSRTTVATIRGSIASKAPSGTSGSSESSGSSGSRRSSGPAAPRRDDHATASRARRAPACMPAASAIGRTSTATTLYSGQLVLTSAEVPISRFVRTSGKWKAVNT